MTPAESGLGRSHRSNEDGDGPLVNALGGVDLHDVLSNVLHALLLRCHHSHSMHFLHPLPYNSRVHYRDLLAFLLGWRAMRASQPPHYQLTTALDASPELFETLPVQVIRAMAEASRHLWRGGFPRSPSAGHERTRLLNCNH